MATSQKQEIDLGLTRLEYDDPERPQKAVLVLSTSKYYNGGLISDATVYWDGKFSRSNCMALGGNGEDWSKRLRVSGGNVKATQRNIDKQHAEVFTPEIIANLLEYAKNHYANQAAA